MCGPKWTARLWALLVSSSVMSGCARTELVAEPSFCAVSGPIMIGREDVLPALRVDWPEIVNNGPDRFGATAIVRLLLNLVTTTARGRR